MKEHFQAVGYGILLMGFVACVANHWGYWNERGRIRALTTRRSVSL